MFAIDDYDLGILEYSLKFLDHLEKVKKSRGWKKQSYGAFNNDVAKSAHAN